MRIGLHLLDIGAFKTQGGVLLHDVGALMRRHGTFEFFIAVHACFTPISWFYKIAIRYMLINKCYMNSITLWSGAEDEQKSEKA